MAGIKLLPIQSLRSDSRLSSAPLGYDNPFILDNLSRHVTFQRLIIVTWFKTTPDIFSNHSPTQAHMLLVFPIEQVVMDFQADLFLANTQRLLANVSSNGQNLLPTILTP